MTKKQDNEVREACEHVGILMAKDQDMDDFHHELMELGFGPLVTPITNARISGETTREIWLRNPRDPDKIRLILLIDYAERTFGIYRHIIKGRC